MTYITTPLKNIYKQALLKAPLFRNVKEVDVEIFMKQAPILVREYKKNTFIALIDEPMEGIGIMLKGHALLTRENMLGQRSIVTDLFESYMFGEALLFTDNPLWPATIQATTNAVVLFIPFTVFAHPIKGHEEMHTQILLNLLHDMSEKALQLNKKVHYLTIKSMRQKIYAYFYELYRKQKTRRLQIPHKRQEMADILNVNRPSMSRELGRLVDEGIIALDGQIVTLLKLEELG